MEYNTHLGWQPEENSIPTMRAYAQQIAEANGEEILSEEDYIEDGSLENDELEEAPAENEEIEEVNSGEDEVAEEEEDLNTEEPGIEEEAPNDEDNPVSFNNKFLGISL